MTTVRPAGSGDIAALVELWRREGGPTRSPGRDHEARRLIGFDPQALLVAERGGQVAGALIVGWDGWRCHLYRLAVEPSARRLGVARSLVAGAVQRAAGLGAGRIDAMVDPGNESAVDFWKAVGLGLDVDRRWSLLL